MSVHLAVVTGALGGLGRCICRDLLKRGFLVVALDICVDEQAIKNFHQEFGPAFFHCRLCDVSDENQFKECLQQCHEEFDGIKVLINNAGLLDETNWQNTYKTNMLGTTVGVKEGLRLMSKNNGGSGALLPFPDAPIYCATKHAILGLTRSYGDAKTWFDRTGVRVSCILPPAIKTKMLDESVKNATTEVKIRSYAMAIEPELASSAVIQLIDDPRTGVALGMNKDVGIFEEMELKNWPSAS